MTTRAVKSDVAAAIERAWAETPSPPEGRITISPDKYDDRAEMQRDLRGRHWREVPHETLFAWRIDLSGLSPEGLRFYLPAWLLAALDDEDIRGFLLGFFVVRARDGRLNETLSFFSSGERAALRAFFEYMAETDEEDWRALAAASERR
jgi:hypothetical protein